MRLSREGRREEAHDLFDAYVPPVSYEQQQGVGVHADCWDGGMDRVPPTGVAGTWARGFRAGPGWSDDHCRQSDDGIMAQGGHGFQRHVAGALYSPFIVLFQEHRADQAEDRRGISGRRDRENRPR